MIHRKSVLMYQFVRPIVVITFLFLVTTAAASASAQGQPETLTPVEYQTADGPVNLTVRVDRTRALVADPILFTIDVFSENGVLVTFPDTRETVGEFHVVAVDDTFDIPMGEGRSWTRRYRLEALTSGTLPIPAITINYSDTKTAPATTGSVTSRAVAIEIGSLLEATDDPLRFRDIKGVVGLVEESPPTYRWIVWTVATGAGLALAASVFLLLRKRMLTADQWALQELDRLECDGLPDGAGHDAHYCRVTDIVREYIERAFDIRAPNQTTAEFLSQLESENRFSESQRSILRALLLIADRVKFARFELSEGDCSDAIGKSREFVRESAAGEVARRNPQEVGTMATATGGQSSGGNRS